jgi:hypothetical protein
MNTQLVHVRLGMHHHILQRDLFAWMLEESLSNPKAPYKVSRKAMAEQLGLTPDVSGLPVGSSGSSQHGRGGSAVKGTVEASSEGEGGEGHGEGEGGET